MTLGDKIVWKAESIQEGRCVCHVKINAADP